MSKKKKEESLEVISSLQPSGDVGTTIIGGAIESIKKEMQAELLRNVGNMLKRRDGLQLKRKTLDMQIAHIDKQINAINLNKFSIVRGQVIFIEPKLNEDCASLYPYRENDYAYPVTNPRDI